MTGTLTLTLPTSLHERVSNDVDKGMFKSKTAAVEYYLRQGILRYDREMMESSLIGVIRELKATTYDVNTKLNKVLGEVDD